MKKPNTDISIEQQNILEQLIVISQSIYNQYEALMKIELELRKKKIDKKDSKKYQKAKKRLNLILSFEIDCYMELSKDPDNYYKYLEYLDQKYENGNILGDYDIIAQNSKDIIIRRISKHIDSSVVFYKTFLSPADYTQVEFTNGDLTSEEKNMILEQIYEYMDNTMNDILIYQQIEKEYNYEFLLNLDKLAKKVSIEDITRVKYQMCFFNDYLENVLFENNYELKNITYDKTKDRSKLKNICNDIDSFYEEDSIDQLEFILEELINDNPDGLKLELLLYDMNIYFDKLNNFQKNKIRREAYDLFEVGNVNKNIVDSCKNMLGDVQPTKIKIKRKKK